MPCIANLKVVSFYLKVDYVFTLQLFLFSKLSLFYSDTLDHFKCHNPVLYSFILLLPV